MYKFSLDLVGAILCITGLILVGNHKWYGFAVTAICSCIYFGLFLIVGCPFSVGLNVILFCIHIRNLRKWKREAKVKA